MLSSALQGFRLFRSSAVFTTSSAVRQPDGPVSPPGICRTGSPAAELSEPVQPRDDHFYVDGKPVSIRCADTRRGGDALDGATGSCPA